MLHGSNSIFSTITSAGGGGGGGNQQLDPSEHSWWFRWRSIQMHPLAGYRKYTSYKSSSR
jgi:hypothetical protein